MKSDFEVMYRSRCKSTYNKMCMLVRPLEITENAKYANRRVVILREIKLDQCFLKGVQDCIDHLVKLNG